MRSRTSDAAKTNAQLLEQIQVLKRSVLELNGQLESLRGEIAKLRGTDEQLTRDLTEVQRRQKDISQGVDDRIRKLEPMKVSVDGREFMADPEEKRQFDDALAVLRNGDFDKAAAAFGGFLRRYPASGYADSARFWQGNALYGKREYKEAIASFRGLVEQLAGPSACARGLAGGGQLPGRGQGHQGRARHHRRADQGLPEVRSRAGRSRAACGAKVARRGSGRARRQASRGLASQAILGAQHARDRDRSAPPAGCATRPRAMHIHHLEAR